MTLCVAWIRNNPRDHGNELVLATDSRLTGDGQWDAGPKLIDLGRGDCLLSFAGDTLRAYPLLLHGAISLAKDSQLFDLRYNLMEVRDHLCDLFTDLVLLIANPSKYKTETTEAALHRVRGEARFLFCGWHWQLNRYFIWRLVYDKKQAKFVAETIYEGITGLSVFCFMGDDENKATENLEVFLAANDWCTGQPLDMEPLQTLIEMVSGGYAPSIGGPIQIGKVYRSCRNEFFGILWPRNTKADHTFLGRKLNSYLSSPVRFYDPETLQIVDQVPETFNSLDPTDYGIESTFVGSCYPSLPGKKERLLKHLLSEAEHERLRRILTSHVYEKFKTDAETLPLRRKRLR